MRLTDPEARGHPNESRSAVCERELRTGVCVVGAGPAGLVLALLLQCVDVPIVVLERLREHEFRRRAAAGMIEHRTVRLLARHGLADAILQHGSRSNVCEFRAAQQAVEFDYGHLTGGRGHYIYPQHELVAALAQRLTAGGGQIRFGCEVTAGEQAGDGATISAVEHATGEHLRVRCDFAVGCDGARSTLSCAIRDASVVEQHHPFRWLALISQAPPSKQRTIYGVHPAGFAGQMRREPMLTRYMLEIPRTDSLGLWPDARIWEELEHRLHARGEPDLDRGTLVERDVLDLRVRMVEPMQDRRVYLAGDAAHLITPAGGKGMNLAIQDALELGCALLELYAGDSAGERLARYSATRLPDVWRAQEFSNWMLALLHAGLGPPSDFAVRLREARLRELVTNPYLARWFAHAYVGVDA